MCAFWLEGCDLCRDLDVDGRTARVLGHEGEAELARELFGQMDLDKDGTVSREEFIGMRNAIRLFLSGADTQASSWSCSSGL